MPTSSNYLALDLGGGGGRAMLVRMHADGRLELEECHRFSHRPVLLEGHWHWDYPRLFAEIQAGIGRAWAASGESLVSLGIDTWGTDFGLLAASGEVVGLPFAYRDLRHLEMVEPVRQLLPDAELYRLTGLQRMPVNTLYQLYAIATSGSPLLEVAHRLLFMPDLFAHLLCGSEVSEYTMASTSQLLDPVRRVWQTEIFARLGLPLEIMPEIVPSGTALGTLLPEQAAEIGVPRLPVRATATHDTASAVAAVPAREEEGPWAFLSSGTWSLVGVEVPAPVVTAEAERANLTNEGGIAGTIRLLKNVTGMWFAQRLQQDFARRGVPLDETELVSAAAAAPAFARFLDPDDPGFHNPPDMVAALDAYLARTGQPPASRPGEYARCVFESLAYRYADILETLERVTGTRLTRVHVLGGGARNDLLNGFTAAASGREVLAGPYEATALGNALVQALAEGVYASVAEMRRAVADSFPGRSFAPTDADQWAQHRDRYHQFCPA